MRGLLFLLLLSASRQEDEAALLIDRLGDDDIQVRERASERLVAIGSPARPALEKAVKGGDPEVAARARSILGEITLEEHRRKVLGPAGRVTLAEGDYTLDQLAAAVKEQTRIPLALPEGMGSERLRIEAKDSLAWEFLGRISRGHGGLRVSSKAPRGSFALEAGKPLDAPLATSGPFRVWMDRLKLERRTPNGQEWSRGSLLLAVSWQPNVQPIGDLFHSPPGMHVSEIQTDGGKKLAVNPRLDTIYSSFSHGEHPTHGYRAFVAFEHPPPEARKLAVVRGHVDVRLPYPKEAVTFDKPASAAGQERKAGRFTIRLKEFREGEERLAILRFEETRRDEARPHRDDPVGLNVRFKAEEALLVEERGAEHPGEYKRSDWESVENGYAYVVAVKFPANVTPASLRLRFLAEYFERRVEFEFKDVELP